MANGAGIADDAASKRREAWVHEPGSLRKNGRPVRRILPGVPIRKRRIQRRTAPFTRRASVPCYTFALSLGFCRHAVFVVAAGIYADGDAFAVLFHGAFGADRGSTAARS